VCGEVALSRAENTAPRRRRPGRVGVAAAALAITLAPTSAAYQDLGALLANQPGVAQRWHDHLIASPFGTIHAATFSFPSPLGTGVPHPPVYALANFDPLDVTKPIATEPLGDGSAPMQFPKVNRRTKHDSYLARERQPMPPLPPVLDIALPAPGESDLVLRPDFENGRFDPYTQYEFPEPIEQPQSEALPAGGDGTSGKPQKGSSRVFFGARPFAPSGNLEPWAPGEAPIVAALGGDPDLKQSALAPRLADEKPGESVAVKGEVTGEDARPKTPAERLKLSGKSREKSEKCLANAVYFEARGEPVRGQIAVAQVVLNRVFSPFYPKTVCDVVYQNAHRHNACQFTFACDGIPDLVTEPDAWLRATRIARDMLDGKLWMPEVGKSTHYHAYWVHPSWTGEMKRMYKLGVHTFYRPRAWGDGSDEPHWGDPKTTAEEAQALQKM
jgi:spore germination cell wall hydrolase CwlJ-like protein